MPRKKAYRATLSAARLAALIRDDWRAEVANRWLPRIVDALAMLADEDIWWRPNDASNSVGNLVLHLCGNMRQWIIAGLAGEPDIRQRDLEFSEKGPIPRAELVRRFRAAVKEAGRVVGKLSPRDLATEYAIQGYRVTGYVAVSHVAAHVAYHAGQILFVIKMKQGRDLGFTRLPPLLKKK